MALLYCGRTYRPIGNKNFNYRKANNKLKNNDVDYDDDDDDSSYRYLYSVYIVALCKVGHCHLQRDPII